MNHKVLLADDSLTIQKVIKITLANQPYDITECFNEDELFKKLPEVQPKIVFLDFNLSEKFTGYELTSKIKAISPNTKVLLLLGTFDTVDDASLEKCGASDKIVKPFDSNKFIAICKQLSNTSAGLEIVESVKEEDMDDEALADPDALGDPEPEDQWQMSNSAAKLPEIKIIEPAPVAAKSNALAMEISDWGMSVPNIINDDSAKEIRFDLPPVIGRQSDEKPKLEVAAKADKEYKPFEVKFPDNGELDYPTIEELQQKPKLISIDNLDKSNVPLEIQGNYVEDKADVSSIEAQIRDEVEEDLWHADEFEELKREVSSKMEEMKIQFDPKGETFDESKFGRLDENDRIDVTEPRFAAAEREPNRVFNTPADIGDLRNEMEAMVKKYVQDYMDQMFKSNVEKVTWEVIPDLAENLIRQELSKISTKIINDQN